MKKIWNTRRPWCRSLSMVMTLALTITMLSGCGTSGGTQENVSMEIQAELPQEVKDEIRFESSRLTDVSEQVKETIGRLWKETEQKTTGKAEETIQELSVQLTELEKQTAVWIAAQKKAGMNLPEKAQVILEQRNTAFE